MFFYAKHEITTHKTALGKNPYILHAEGMLFY